MGPQQGDSVSSAAMEALTETLIKKLHESFGEVAKDEASKEVISQEVSRFMGTTHSVNEKDIVRLEERIRNILTGGTPVKNAKVLEKQAMVENDEWSKIYGFMKQIGDIEEQDKKRRAVEQARRVQAALEEQRAERAAREAADAAAERAEYEAQQAELAAWKAEEEARKQRHHQAMEMLKHDVDQQLQERRRNREWQAAIRHKEEVDMTNRIAYETKRQIEDEEVAHRKAKEDLKSFLLSNEVNKQIKERERLRQQEEERLYTKQHADILDKQERARAAQMEKLRAIQARQAEIASHRPPAKRWIDPAIIEKNFKQRLEAEEREEWRRQEAAAERVAKFRRELSAQLADKRERGSHRGEELQKEREYIEKVLRDEAAAEAAKKAREAEKRAKFRRELDAQAAESQVRRVVQPMSETEKRINAQLLKKIADMQLGGLPQPAAAAQGNIRAVH